MPEFPIMGTDDAGIIHRIGYDHTGRMWTACGLRAERLAAILAYNPGCPKCIDALDDPHITPPEDASEVHQYDGSTDG